MEDKNKRLEDACAGKPHMKIAICEDEEVMAKQIWGMFFNKPEIDAKYYLSPQELLSDYESGIRYQVLFCDARMEPFDGIALAKKIREFDKDVYIVFVTNYIEFAPKGYEVGLFRFLLKPVTAAAVERVLSEIVLDMKRSSKILLKTAEGSMIMDSREILYVEISDKESCVYYNGDSVCVGKSLSELEDQLEAHAFFRIHRKYLVNLNRVREFDRYHLTLDNGKSLPVSRRKAHEFKEALYYFLEDGVS